MTKLGELIELFGTGNEQIKTLKKGTDVYNKEIKQLMKEEGLSKAESTNYVANYSVSVSESFDEELLLETIKKLPIADMVVKTKEYVDMESLESAIYDGLINPAELSKCKIRKETPKLVVKVRK